MLPAEPRWLSVEAVAAINRDIVEKSDEPHVVRHYAALKSAAYSARPSERAGRSASSSVTLGLANYRRAWGDRELQEHREGGA